MKRLAALVLAGFALCGVALFAAAPLIAQDNGPQSSQAEKDGFVRFVEDRLSTPERQIRLSNIEGVLSSDASINEITVSDAQGVWLRIEKAAINWNQAALLLGRLEIRSLSAESIDYLRQPVPSATGPDLPAPEAGGIAVPELPVAIILDKLSVPRVTFGESVFGLGSAVAVSGNLLLEAGSLDTALAVTRLDGPGGQLDLKVKYVKGDGSVDIGLALTEPPNGIIANLLNIENRPEVRLSLAGTGPVTNLATNLTLDAGGRRALSGTALVRETAEGFAVNAELGGPVSDLVAPAYRAFFGAQTRLTTTALVRSGGGFDIETLALSGGQLALTASASTTADNFLSALALKARIADASGTPVTLPVAGAATTIGAADISVDFGGQDWSASIAASDFATGGLTASTLAIDIGGIAANLTDPATRRITFNGDGTLSGLAASDPDIAAALGTSLGFGLAGLWNAGGPVKLAELRLAGKAIDFTASGALADAVFTGDIAVATPSLAAFSGLAGRSLSGALDLAASGTLSPLSGGFDLNFDGTGTSLGIGEKALDALLSGPMRLTGRLARTEKGIEAEQFTLANAAVKILADGSFATGAADFVFRADLADLASLSPAATGALAVVGTARGQGGVIGLNLDATMQSGTLAQKPVTGAKLGFAGTLNDDGLLGDITGTASLNGARVDLASALAVSPDAKRLTGLVFETAGTRLTGDITQSTDGLLTGRLDLAASDISTAAALALVEARGAVNAAILLDHADAIQGAGVSAKIRDLAFGGIRIATADLSATLSDLFGTPLADGTASGRGITAEGLDIGAFSVTATRQDGATSFTASADLSGGSAIAGLGIAPLALKASGNLAENLVTLSSVTASGASGLSLTGSGRVPLSGSRLALDVSGTAPLALANRFVVDRGGQASGTLSLSARVSGSLDDPRFAGSVSTSGAQYVDPALNLRLLDIAGSADLTTEAITINTLTARLSTGGSLSASGSIAYAEPGLPADLALRLAGARYADGNMVVATLSGDLALTGPITAGGLLSGDILVEKADITVPDRFGASSSLIAVDHLDLPRPVADTLVRALGDQRTPRPGARPSALRLDVNVRAPNQIFVRGRGLDVELGGAVRLTGLASNIVPVGGFELNRGRLAILGQRVSFDSGSVSLIGDLDPVLNFTARTQGEDITVFITVTGPVSDLTIEFSSTPALPQDEVLSRLLFKRGVTELSPLQLARLAGAAAELAGGSNSSLLDSLRSATGLDDLEVVTDEQGNAAVRAGSYIQDNVYLGVEAGANGQSRVSIDLDIAPGVTARGSAGSDGSTSLGLFYEQDY